MSFSFWWSSVLLFLTPIAEAFEWKVLASQDAGTVQAYREVEMKVHWFNESSHTWILVNSSRSQRHDECRLKSLSLLPIQPSSWAEFDVVCSFGFAGQGLPGNFRQTQVNFYRMKAGSKEPLQPVAISIRAQVINSVQAKMMDMRLSQEYPAYHQNASGSVTYQYRYQGKLLVLTGRHCRDLLRDAIAIQSWSRKLQNFEQVGECSCRDTLERGVQYCELDVGNLIPVEFRPQLSSELAAEGPNCWNTSLRSAGLIEGVRHSTAEELDFYLNSKFCQELPLQAAAEPGDLIAIRNPRGELLHAFTYISPKISFSKPGLFHQHRIQFYAPSAVFNESEYKTDPECQRVSSKTIPGRCKNKNSASYFRCSSQALRQVKRAASVELKQLDRWIQEREELLTGWSVYGVDASRPLDAARMGRLESELRSQLRAAKRRSGAVDRELLESMTVKIGAMLESIDYLKSGRYYPPLL